LLQTITKLRTQGKETNDYLLPAKVTKSTFALIPQSGVVHIVMAIAQPPPSLRRNATTLTPPFKYRISTAPKSSHFRSTKQQEEEPIDEKQEGEREITEAERDN